MEVSGWGRHPFMEATVVAPGSADQFRQVLREEALIARGLGRSYGDSSLASCVACTTNIDHFLAFDESSGRLTCEAGVSFDSIIGHFLPRGWFLPVTPGTRFITVGGAIASDVHGKNHHVDGSFSNHVESFDMLLGNGDIVRVSRNEHADLFQATCGGMGLTGIILRATFQLRRVQSSAIVETTIKAPTLDSALQTFAAHSDATYSVAWIDCMARGRNFGRSVIMLGEHATDGDLSLPSQSSRRVPIQMPSVFLNPMSIRAFNALYYWKAQATGTVRHTSLIPYFYPLDAIADWNLLYGRHGFLQYQFVIPHSNERVLYTILEAIVASGRASPLAVLKLFGAGNDCMLSFPMAGYTLAVDFKVEREIFTFLDALDNMVRDAEGRLYLSKDARMNNSMFRAGYPRWQEFEDVRLRHHALGRFSSAQSQRLGLR